MITELNNSSFVTIVGDNGSCTWCDGGIGWNGTRVRGQIVEVTSVSGTTIGFTPALYSAFTLTPLATPFTMSAKYAGAENFQVYANNTGYRTNFLMQECAYCWISGVEGNYADGDQVEVEWSYRGQVVNSYFSNAFSHVAGTTDADVFIVNKTSGFLVQNNILERLHGSIILNWGAAGNVVAYNYMLGNFDSSAPNLLMFGTATHGAHPQWNLYEGNVTHEMGFDSTWGSSSHGTLYRNWVKGTTKVCNPLTGRGAIICSPMGVQGQGGVNGWWAVQANRAITMNALQSTYNFVGNVIGSTEMANLHIGNGATPMPQVDRVVAVCGPPPCGSGSRSYANVSYAYSFGYWGSGDTGGSANDSLVPYSTLFLHGDYSNVTGVITWITGTTHTLPASFYLSLKPSWWGTMPWPAAGPDVTGGSDTAVMGHAYANPANVCYNTTPKDSNGILLFDPNTCYGKNPPPTPPTNLRIQ